MVDTEKHSGKRDSGGLGRPLRVPVFRNLLIADLVFDGFLFLDRSKFTASFAADVKPDLAAFMADSQVPWGVQSLEGVVSQPSWKSKPSWYLVATDDKMIPPDAQRAISKRAGANTVEVNGSRAVYVSQPEAVADLIAQAAEAEAGKVAAAA